MKLPRLDPATKQVYDSALPPDPRIETRSMFGGLGSFVNGNMFAGALGNKMFVRLPDTERAALLKEPGGGPFEPVKGHAMAGYATIPESWMKNPARVRGCFSRFLEWVAAMPPKKKAKKGPAKKK